MENLPLEVFETVCEYLDSFEARRRSLLAFALTSKVCCADTARERFSRISLKVQSPRQLRLELKRLDDLSAVDGRKRVVPKLKIAGSIPASAWNKEGEETDTGDMSRVESNQNDADEDQDDAFADLPTSYISARDPSARTTGEEGLRHEGAWKPLSVFISE